VVGVEYWVHGQGGEVAIMKGLLGVLAVLIGTPLVIGGLYVAVYAGCVVDPTIAGEGLTTWIALMGLLAAAVGACFCFGAWLALRRVRK